MVTTPPAIPVTMPLPPTVAIEAPLLLQTPPAVTSDNDVVAPAHSLVMPEIAATTGAVLTVFVTLASELQPNILVTV